MGVVGLEDGVEGGGAVVGGTNESFGDACKVLDTEMTNHFVVN